MVQTAATVDTSSLRSYLSDHLAGSRAGVGVAKKLAERHPGDDFWQGLARSIEEDQDALERVMDKIGAEENPVKSAGAKVAQSIGTGMSGASGGGSAAEMGVVREAEGLYMGISGKVCLWDTLNEIADTDERLGGFNFGRLIQSAKDQLEGLEAERLKLARKAFLH